MPYFKKFIMSLALAFSFWGSGFIMAQEVIEIEPLFEYPVAPEELSSLTEKSDYLVEHFWDNMDFKTRKTVDQSALNHAFKVYTAPLRWAHRDKSVASVNKLLTTLQKNPTLLFQFTKAAEENLYGPRADIWADDIYIPFLQMLIKSKKISEQRKSRYVEQLTKLEACQVGHRAPAFDFNNRNGESSTYFPMSTVSLLIFGDPSDADWRLDRLRMEANAKLSQLVDKGKINILFILPNEKEDWKIEVADYNPKWVVGCGDSLDDKLDLRVIPSIYVIGQNGDILMKNAPLQTAIESAFNEVK